MTTEPFLITRALKHVSAETDEFLPEHPRIYSVSNVANSCTASASTSRFVRYVVSF